MVTDREQSNSTDVFVVGGGPAGLAAAIAARQRGLRVMLADGATPPIDKPCGEGLMADGIHALRRLGITLEAQDAYSFCGIRFLAAGLAVEAKFPRGDGLGVRRTTLHRVMTQRAAEAGVELLWRTQVTGISAAGVSLGTSFVRARWIIGADGINSRVRRWANLDSYLRNDSPRYGFRRHYRVAPWTNRVELYWGPRSQIYVTPVTGDQVGVALISRDPKLRLETALADFPALHDRLRNAEIQSPEKGAVSTSRKLRRVCRGNVALIGDASGTVDAITGEGLCLSFRQALALADCLAAEEITHYPAVHNRLSRRPLMMSRLLLTLDGRPRLQERVLQAFHKRPDIFQGLLALHIGVPSPIRLAWDGISLGWGVLTA